MYIHQVKFEPGRVSYPQRSIVLGWPWLATITDQANRVQLKKQPDGGVANPSDFYYRVKANDESPALAARATAAAQI